MASVHEEWAPPSNNTHRANGTRKKIGDGSNSTPSGIANTSNHIGTHIGGTHIGGTHIDAHISTHIANHTENHTHIGSSHQERIDSRTSGIMEIKHECVLGEYILGQQQCWCCQWCCKFFRSSGRDIFLKV
jgi:hypothetical protein